MADYYSLLKKAVSRLDPFALPESRQAIYERARTAQLAQLRSNSPPLSGSEITREQLALEEAVGRVEAEVVQPARDVQVPAISDLVAAADEIGRPISRIEDRALAKALVSSFSPPSNEMPLPMILRGGATGRLVRYWRWRGQAPRTAAPNEPAGDSIFLAH